MNPNKFRKKIFWIVLFLTVFLFFVIFKLFNLQVINNARYAVEASVENNFDNTLQSLRGVITASTGLILAGDRPVYDVYVDKTQVKNKKVFINTVSSVLSIPKSKLLSILNSKYIWVQLENNVSSAQKNELSNISSLVFEQHEGRYYPDGSLFADILGFLSVNNGSTPVGNYGIEGYFNGALEGHNGFTSGTESALGIPILSSNYQFVPPKNGDTIKLTVVPALQNILSTSLDYWTKKEDATSGTAILMDPKTGAILAMSSYPTYNPNDYWNYNNNDFANNAINFIYEPGSVGKLVTAVAAINTGKMTPSTTVDDSTGVFTVGGKNIYNWNKEPDGVMNLAQILKLSSNVGASIVATKYLSSQTLYNYSLKLGFGKLTGIMLQGEETGVIPNYQSWNESNLATASFGQFYGVSPLQIIDAYDTVANGGKRMEPYIVQSITTPGGKTINFTPKVLDNVVSPSVASEITQMLVYATPGEPNWALNKEGVGSYMPIIASKTGSAQVPSKKNPGQYSNSDYVMTYVGYAPANNPQFILLTMMNDPKKPLLNQYYAATTACVEWGQMAKGIFDYFNISP